MDDETKDKIKKVLEDWVREVATKFPDRMTAVDRQPFHTRLVPREGVAGSRFERTFSTKLGTVFQDISVLVAEQHFDEVSSQYRVIGYVSKRVLNTIREIMSSVDAGRQGNYNYHTQVSNIVELAQKEPEADETVKHTVDLYLKKGENETFFELKAPKPNKDQCIRMTNGCLEIHAERKAKKPRVRTWIGMAYNPDGDGIDEYDWSQAKRYLDVKRQVLMGKQYWSFLDGGNKNAMNELLEVFEEVGKTSKPMFLDAMRGIRPESAQSAQPAQLVPEQRSDKLREMIELDAAIKALQKLPKHDSTTQKQVT